MQAAVRPTVQTSTDTAILPRPQLVDNLWFGADGSVYAGFLLSGLPYHLQSDRRKTGVADLHMLLGRELPADSWLYGLGVAQDQRQLLRAMVHGYRDRNDWVASCAQVAEQLAEQAPKTRLYWLMVPVDAGRAGHNVVGSGHQAQRLVRRPRQGVRLFAARLRRAGVRHRQLASPGVRADAGDPRHVGVVLAAQHLAGHLHRTAAAAATRHARASPPTSCPPRRSTKAINTTARAGPASSTPCRPGRSTCASRPQTVRSPSPTATRRSCRWSTHPKAGSCSPARNSSPLSTISTPVPCSTSRSTSPPVRASWSSGATTGPAATSMTSTTTAATSATATPSCTPPNAKSPSTTVCCRPTSTNNPSSAAFFVHVGAADARTLDHSIKRLREEMTQSGQIVIRHYRGVHTRLWSVFNPGVPQHKSGADQFSHATTASKWSRFVPLISSQLGNATGMLLGFNKSNANNSAVLLDLPGTARRNHNPCLICAGAPGYGKSYTAKRIVKAELQRGAQAFIVEPDEYGEWATALADVPNKAVIDMAGGDFGCDALRIFPERVAGSYWLDYMIPMLGLDVRSVAVGRLRTLLTPAARRALGITSTAALMRYIRDIQAPVGEADTRPPQVGTARRRSAARPAGPGLLGHLRIHPRHLRRHPAHPGPRRTRRHDLADRQPRPARRRRNGQPAPVRRPQ